MTLTDKDIEKMMQVFATKDEVRKMVGTGVSEIKELVQSLVGAADKPVTEFSKLNIEYAALKDQSDRHGEWIGRAADTIGVPFTK